MNRRTQLILGGITLTALGLTCALRFRVTTDVTEFLALAGGRERAELSRKLANSDLTRTMVLSVGGGDEARVLAAAAGLAERLERHPEVAWVRTGLAAGTERAFYTIYYPRRFLFLSDAPEEELPTRWTNAALGEAAAELKRRLASPMGAFVKRTATGDPWQSFMAHLERLDAARGGGLDVVDGRFLAGGQAIVFLASEHSAFDASTQGPLLDAILAAFAEVDPKGELTLEQSGVNRVARDSELSIKADITRISVLSTVGIVALFLLLFRSPRYVLLGLVPLGSGVLAATAVSLLLFGRVHGITLAFGSSLIGVCIDYPVHLFNHYTLDRDPEHAMQRVWPGLLLGALTTVVGFGGLMWTSFPGIREIAVFGSAGVLAALVATRALTAPLLPRNPQATQLQRRLAERLSACVAALARRRGQALAAPALALALCAVGLPQLSWLDDPQALYEQNPELMAEQLRVRQRVSRVDGSRFVIAVGADAEQALRINDAVFERLSRSRDAGALDGFRSLHGFLWSADLQARNWKAVTSAPELAQRTLAALEGEGFVAAAFSEFSAALTGPQPAPLRLQDLAASPLSQLVDSFVVDLEGQVGILTYLRGVHDTQALDAALEELPGVVYLDQRMVLGTAYRNYRLEVLKLTAGGLLLVFLLVFARYRRLRPTVVALAPALLASATTLALLALAGVTLHLLHTTALLLVLSIGADYGIFLAESRSRPDSLGPTALSIATACLTTVLAFGLLALSSAPVLRAIGLTVGVGVVLSLVLAPSVLALSDPASSR